MTALPANASPTVSTRYDPVTPPSAIPPPPPDPALPGLVMALDGHVMADMLIRELDDCRTGTLRLVSCRPTYIRYKPGTSCLISYALRFALPGETIATEGHIRLGDPARAKVIWQGRSLQRVVERARGRHTGPPEQRAALLPDLDAVLQMMPVDRELPALVALTDRSKMRRLLGKALAGDERALRLKDVELLRYRPARKALVRLTLRRPDRRTFYAKIYRDRRAARMFALSHELADVGLPVPRAVALLDEIAAVVSQGAEGLRLADLHGHAEFAAFVGAAGSELARLHRAPLSPGVVAKRVSEVELVLGAGRALARLCPLLSERLDRLTRRLALEIAATESADTVIHGDFYDDQILVGPAGVTLLDFDEARHGDPLVDVGNLLAHLSDRCPTDVAAAAREAFLRGYGREHAADPRRAALFEAAAALRMAVGPFRRLEPDWPSGVARLVGLAEQRLEEAGGARRMALHDPHTTAATAPPRHEGLSQMALLLQPSVMENHLSTALEAKVRIVALDAVRHKPGRRCTVRYEVAIEQKDGTTRAAQLYGKAYATGRAHRVHTTCGILARAVQQDRLRLPRPVAYIEALDLHVQSAVAGEPITPRLLADDEDLAAAIAEALHALHVSDAILPRNHAAAGELDPLAQRVDGLARHAPGLGKRARSCHALLASRLESGDPWRRRPLHRDMYHDQVLADGLRIAFVDIDDAAMGDPALDVANFIAHLRLLSLQRPGSEQPLASVGAAFLTRYRELDADLDEELVRDLGSASLVRLAAIHHPRPDGDRVAAGLLAAAERALAAVEYAP